MQRYLPSSVDAANYRNYQDSEETDLYDKLLRETDFARQRALMRLMLWWYRTVSDRSYVKGWKISPSRYLNQEMART